MTVEKEEPMSAHPAFDLDDPVLPDWVREGAMQSGGFPYDKRLKSDVYEETLHALQVQLVRLQADLLKAGGRVICVFEGRDAAGKGGAINAYRENLNPRTTAIAALPKPSDRERTQWYFQRYVDWLPAAGETVLFDRSWYNRSGVELVMGFCTPAETEVFLKEVPRFERMLVDDGIKFFKFYIDIGREMQIERFHDRRHDPLKQWKLSPVDLKALQLWDEYTAARDRTLAETHTSHAPWTVIRGNDKRRARIEVIRAVVGELTFEGKDEAAIGKPDRRIAMSAPDFLGAARD